MYVSPLAAALCAVGVTLAGVDYALLITAPGSLDPRVGLLVLLIPAAAGGLAGLVAAAVNLANGHSPRIRRRR